MSDENVEKTKQQIRGLVGEIQQYAKSDLGPEEFYAAVLTRIVQSLAASGGAIWTLGEAKKPQLAYQTNISQELLNRDSDDAAKHFRLLDYIIASNQPQLIPPLSSAGDERLGGNPTRHLLVIAPLGHDNEVEALIEIFQRPEGQPQVQRGYLKFLLQMSEFLSEWFKNRKLRQFSDRHSLWAEADRFSRAAHESLDLRETCYTIVNEGRRMLGVDRVSIALKKGGSCVVEAVSGQDTIENRSNVVTLLGSLATKVVASGEPLWYLGSTEDMPPQIENALEEYVDQSHTRSLAVLPLRKPAPAALEPGAAEQDRPQGEILGALIIEQIESEIPRQMLDPKLDFVFEHSARALSNSVEHHSLFLMPLWKTLGKAAWVVNARNLPRTALITGGVLALLLFVLICPADFVMKASGVLQPVERNEVFVPERAIVREVLVDNGQLVQKGQPLLRLESAELKQQIERVRSEYNARLEQVSAIRARLTDNASQATPQERRRDEAELASTNRQVEGLKTELDLLEKRNQDLTILAPTTGSVITWDAKRTLTNRPVETGQALLTVAAADTPYEVELFMPERRVKHLEEFRIDLKKKSPADDLVVDYILMTEPGAFHSGVLRDVHRTAELHAEHGQMVRLRVELTDKVENPRPGTTVTAKVKCGRTNLAWAYLYEAWEWFEANVLFF